jgi:ParB/RepB/Spo0J family partition protein
MQIISLSDIIIPPERQRKEFKEDAILELSTSIREIGLLQPIVLRDDQRTLVCGERRIKAVSALHQDFRFDGSTVSAGSIPFVRTSDLTVDQLYQAELEENLCRRDLTWQEKAIALKKYHQLRQKQQAQTGQVQTVAATASEVLGKKAKGRQVTEINNSILLAEYMNDPEVAAQRTPEDALKVIRETKSRRDRKLRAEAFDLSKSPHVLHVADCYLDAPQRYPEAFDVVLCDPPYGIDAHKKDTFDASSHEYDDSEVAFARVLQELPAVIRAITKPAAHLYLFCDIRRFERLFVAFELGGFTVWGKPLIWDKGNTGSYGNIDYGPRACYDAVLYARKGDRKVLQVKRDVINITQPTNLPHPAGKPPELFQDLLSRSCLPGDKVADLFCGSGPIYPAASALKLTAVGWENHPTYVPMAQEAIAKTIRS